MAPSAVSETQSLLEEIQAQAKSIPTKDARGYSIEDKLLGALRPIKIIVIGFGASAINIVHALGQEPGSNITMQCYEKNPEIGGTWYENT